MKKYHCDGGSIMIGTKESRTCFPNGYGDGEHYVNVVNTEKQKKEFNKEKKLGMCRCCRRNKFSCMEL